MFGGADHRIMYANGDQIAYVSFAFEARAAGGTLAPDGKESVEARYVARDEAPALDLSPQTRRAVAVVFAETPGTYFDPPTWIPSDDRRLRG